MSKQLIQQETAQGCCSTTDEGAAICLVPSNGQSSSCGRQQHAETSPPKYTPTEQSAPGQLHIMPQKTTSVWQKVRGGLMFAVACITSPCCTPLIVPLGLALLAGTPAAVWLSAHIGWVYGGLTLVSAVSLIVGIRWLKQKNTVMPFPRSTTHSQSPITLETKSL